MRWTPWFICTLLCACAGEPSHDVTEKPPVAKLSETPSKTASAQPTQANSGALKVTPAEAEAAGLPKLGLSLTLTGSGMSGSGPVSGSYASLSGPPGGPLILTISPATVGAAFADLVGEHALEARLVEEEVELLGAKRRAAAWVTGESLARTSWCGVIVAPEGAEAGAPALLLELGVGHGGDEVRCATARGHHVLGPVVDSLELLTE